MTWLESWLALWQSSLVEDLPRLGFVVALYLALGLFEHWFPAERGQRLLGRLRNVGFGAIFIVAGLAANSAILASYPLEAPTRVQQAGPGGVLLICLGYLFLMDFLYYWYHRAQHRFPLLWSIHELHHADAGLNVTTSMRTYWIEMPIQFLIVSFPALFLLGIDRGAVVLLPIVSTTILLFTHANLRLRLGPLTPIFCGPQVHRIHHSNLPGHRDRNFAQVFTFFDVLFGTYRRPDRDEFPTTGVEELASDAPLATVMVRPFRLVGRALAPSPAPVRPRRRKSARRRRRRA